MAAATAPARSAPGSGASASVRRFGAFLAPSIFVTSALGILAAPEGTSPSVAVLHVELGFGLVAFAGWAFIVAGRLGDLRSRVLAGVAFFPALVIVLLATTIALTGLPLQPLADRVLALTSLAGAVLMFALGSGSPTSGRPLRDPLGGALAPGSRSIRAFVRNAGPAVLTIAVLFLVFQGVSTLVVATTGLPPSLPGARGLQLLGAAVLGVSGVLTAWVFLYRRPVQMIESTGATFSKLFGAEDVAAWSGRTEPLVVVGPQRYVRHPLYLSVILLLLGWGLLTLSTVTLLETVPFLVWFLVVQIPFEERELRTLYGEAFARYAEHTPKLLPHLRSQGR